MSPLDRAGCTQHLEQANAMASLDRAVRRCQRCFAAGSEPKLVDRVASALGVERTPEPAPQVKSGHPRQRRRPRAGEVEALRQTQADAAQAISQRYSDLRIEVERLFEATHQLDAIGAYPCHADVDPRAWALVELMARHDTLVPQAQDWIRAHTRWIAPLLDGRADARDRQLSAHEETAP